MRSEGKLTVCKDDRAFGFIKLNSGGDDVYIHIRSFANQTRLSVAANCSVLVWLHSPYAAIPMKLIRNLSVSWLR